MVIASLVRRSTFKRNGWPLLAACWPSGDGLVHQLIFTVPGSNGTSPCGDGFVHKFTCNGPGRQGCIQVSVHRWPGRYDSIGRSACFVNIDVRIILVRRTSSPSSTTFVWIMWIHTCTETCCSSSLSSTRKKHKGGSCVRRRPWVTNKIIYRREAIL